MVPHAAIVSEARDTLTGLYHATFQFLPDDTRYTLIMTARTLDITKRIAAKPEVHHRHWHYAYAHRVAATDRVDYLFSNPEVCGWCGMPTANLFHGVCPKCYPEFVQLRRYWRNTWR